MNIIYFNKIKLFLGFTTLEKIVSYDKIEILPKSIFISLKSSRKKLIYLKKISSYKILNKC